MSTIITTDMATGKPKLCIYAPDSSTVIHATDLRGWIIEITGDAKMPFIHGVRFIESIIIADSLSAFQSCYFDLCEMKVKNLPKVIRSTSVVESINMNAINSGDN